MGRVLGAAQGARERAGHVGQDAGADLGLARADAVDLVPGGVDPAVGRVELLARLARQPLAAALRIRVGRRVQARDGERRVADLGLDRELVLEHGEARREERVFLPDDRDRPVWSVRT